MKPGMGRLKGSIFERKVAGMVVATFKDYGITSKDCYRTPLSGGHQYASKTDPGDLVISPKLRKLFNFHVECKSYASIRLDSFLYPVKAWKKSWKCSKWLAQIDAAKVGTLTPLLVFKENHGEILAAFPVRECDPALTFRCRLSFWYHGEEWLVVRFKKLLASIVKRIEA